MVVLLACSAPTPPSSTHSLQPPPHHGTVPVSTSTQHTATSTVQYSAVYSCLRKWSRQGRGARGGCHHPPASVSAGRGGTPGPGTAVPATAPIGQLSQPPPLAGGTALGKHCTALNITHSDFFRGIFISYRPGM